MPKISAYPAGGAIQALDEFVIARVGANYHIRGASFMPASGMMVNGYIQPGVAANNLTLSLLTMAGTPPSATDPVYIRIGNGWRAITAALSVTANAATNWMNLGGSALATKEADLFAYGGYNVTDGVVLGFSRIPGAKMYSDFNTTSTNEKYARISTILNAAAGDQYSVIGRFAATLSAGAGFTWTQPVSSFSNLVQRPIYESRWLDWTPAGTNLTNTGATIVAKYKVFPDHYLYQYSWKFGAGSAVGTTPNIILPFNTGLSGGSIVCGSGNILDSGTGSFGAVPYLETGNNKLYPIVLTASGTYVAQAFLTAIVPMTWTNGDEIQFTGDIAY